MKIILARILISAVTVVILGMLLPGVHVEDSWSAVITAFFISLLNATLRPILILFTLPVTVFTLGLFLFVINAFIILLASRWLEGFSVDGFWWALLFSFLLSFINSVLQKLLLKNYQQEASS